MKENKAFELPHKKTRIKMPTFEIVLREFGSIHIRLHLNCFCTYHVFSSLPQNITRWSWINPKMNSNIIFMPSQNSFIRFYSKNRPEDARNLFLQKLSGLLLDMSESQRHEKAKPTKICLPARSFVTNISLWHIFWALFWPYGVHVLLKGAKGSPNKQREAGELN